MLVREDYTAVWARKLTVSGARWNQRSGHTRGSALTVPAALPATHYPFGAP